MNNQAPTSSPQTPPRHQSQRTAPNTSQVGGGFAMRNKSGLQIEPKNLDAHFGTAEGDTLVEVDGGKGRTVPVAQIKEEVERLTGLAAQGRKITMPVEGGGTPVVPPGSINATTGMPTGAKPAAKPLVGGQGVMPKAMIERDQQESAEFSPQIPPQAPPMADFEPPQNASLAPENDLPSPLQSIKTVAPAQGTEQAENEQIRPFDFDSNKYQTTPVIGSGEKFESIGLPSYFLWYDFKELHIRALSLQEITMIAQADKKETDTDFINVIGRCLSEDIRSLTPGDLRHVLYVLWFKSYPRTPFKVEWQSRYGNNCSQVITTTDLQLRELQMTQEQVNDWRARGYDIPRFRDIEYAMEHAGNMTEEDAFLWDLAMWIQGDSPTTKLENLQAIGLDGAAGVKELAKLTDHGVDENMKVVDPNFDPKQWAIDIQERIAVFRQWYLEAHERGEFVAAKALLDSQIVPLETELNHLKGALERGEEVTAQVENFQASITAATFVSPIRP